MKGRIQGEERMEVNLEANLEYTYKPQEMGEQ